MYKMKRVDSDSGITLEVYKSQMQTSYWLMAGEAWNGKCNVGGLGYVVQEYVVKRPYWGGRCKRA